MKRLGKKKENQKGFSLVELIIVIAILGIIAAIAIPNITGALNDARKQTDITNARSIANTLIMYRAKEALDDLNSSWNAQGTVALTDEAVPTNLLNELNLPNAETKFDPSVEYRIQMTVDGVITIDAEATGDVLYPTPSGRWQ